MESQPQNPEFRNNPENFHPCLNGLKLAVVVLEILNVNRSKSAEGLVLTTIIYYLNLK